MLVICVATDKKFSNIPKFLQPIYIGFTLLAIGIAYGANSGYALNPVSFVVDRQHFVGVTVYTDCCFSKQARDLGPRIVSYLGGWGPGVFRFSYLISSPLLKVSSRYRLNTCSKHVFLQLQGIQLVLDFHHRSTYRSHIRRLHFPTSSQGTSKR